jgi:F-type H+-transporting ATPase subunit epsilon
VRLVVRTPDAVVVDREVEHVRAEDASGTFGLLSRHADFVTALEVSVVVYRDAERREHFVAVRGGLLTMSDGALVSVLTREAEASDDLTTLSRDVLARFRSRGAAEARARASAGKLQGALLQHVSELFRRGAVP